MGDVVAVYGSLPAHVDKVAVEHFGVYQTRHKVVNGRRSYVKIDDERKALWSDASDQSNLWCVGDTEDIGTRVCVFWLRSGAQTPDASSGRWKVEKKQNDDAAVFVSAPNVHVVAVHLNMQNVATNASTNADTGASNSEEEVTVVSTTTPATRDAEARKRAIDLDLLDSVSKRPKVASVELETRVAKARSLCSSAVNERVESLIQPALKDFVARKIDLATFGQRQESAREKAETEIAPLSTLNAEFDQYTAALAARVAAQENLDHAIATEDAIEAKLQETLRELLGAQVGEE